MSTKRHENSRRWARLASVAVVLLLAGPQLPAAVTPGSKELVEPVKLMNEKQWEMAEPKFAEFLRKYTNSEYYAEAVVYQATARFQMARTNGTWNYADVINLLTAQKDRAGNQADQFAHWLAEANYYSSNFPAAAENYARLVRDYPNSTRRFEAIFKEAESRVKLGDPAGVIEGLRDPNGAFQQAVRTNAYNEWLVRGIFLLTETELAARKYPEAEEALRELPGEKLEPKLEWQRQYLVCRTKLAGGNASEALQNGPGLLQAADNADLAAKSSLKAKSIELVAEIHRSLEQWTDAIASYETNLTSDVPEARRQAMMNIVELHLGQNQTEAAAARLDAFLKKYPEEQGSDFGFLALAELRLKQHFQALAANPAAAETIFLQQAKTNLVKVVNEFSDSVFLDKAQLNLGWCLLEENKLSESQAAFSTAVTLLARARPLSKDLAVALFKLADVMFLQKNYAGAITNYLRVIGEFGAVAEVKNELFERALYQTLRAGIAAPDLAAATNALGKLLDWFPTGPWGEPGSLLLGQALNQGGNSAGARSVFSDFNSRWPDSPLRPEVELAIARTYEREDAWNDAVTKYRAWIDTYTNHSALPRAEFSLALAEDRGGNEPQAFSLFTNFVARYPANELAPRAQIWVGDYYRKNDNFKDAELSYQGVTNGPLMFQALMSAGRSAMRRPSAHDAIDYFKRLANNTNCPLELRLEALYAQGDATIVVASSTATNLSSWREAADIFEDIASNKKYPTNRLTVLAWGRLGDCSLQRATQDASQYLTATNAYHQAMASTLADITVRSQAEFGLGQALEKMARDPSGNAERRSELIRLALDHYLHVVNGGNVRENEKQNLLWEKEAGLAAGHLLEEAGDWDRAYSLYQTLQVDLEQLKPALEKRLVNVRKHLSEQGK